MSRRPLDDLLRNLRPVLHEKALAFCLLPPDFDAGSIRCLCLFREAEGMTLVVDEEVAAEHGWEVVFRAAWITLSVDSDLQAVGLTAAVAGALAAVGISCNVIAAIHHDHLFVPVERGEAALAVLQRLQS